MPKQYDLQLRFTVYSKADLLPEAIEKLLGIQADRTALIGSRSMAPKTIPVANVYSLISKPAQSNASLTDHWRTISHKLTNKENELSNLKQRCEFRLTIVVDARERAPSVIVPTSLCEFCSRFQIELDIDIDQN